MEIQIKDTVTKTVNIELPYYSKSNCHFHKVISENESICITMGVVSKEISYREYQTTAFDSDNLPSNETEFQEAFNIAVEFLKTKL